MLSSSYVFSMLEFQDFQSRTTLFHFSLFFLTLASLFALKWLISTRYNKLISTSSSKSEKRLVPSSPPRLPIIGNLHQLGEHAHQTLRVLARTYGSLMMIYLGSIPSYVVSSADGVRDMLKMHDIVFSNRSDSYIYRTLLYDHRDILLAPYGEYWRHMRAICVLQLLSTKRVQSYQAVREEEIAIMMGKIKRFTKSNSSMDLSKMLGTLTNDILCRVAFGKKYSEGDDGKEFKTLFDEFGYLLGVFNIGEYIPWLNWINHFNGLNTRINRNSREFNNLLDQVVDDHMTSRSKEGPKENDKMDLLDVLLENQQNSGESSVIIAKTNIKAILADMFAGGSDTTYAAIEWTMTELIRYPEAMNQVQQEIRLIVGGRSSITKDDIQKMNYLKAAIKETLRMHPPIPLIPRLSTQEVEIQGYTIPAHTRVFINISAVGRDANRWAEPDEFKPERFLDGNAVDAVAQEFDFMPFGGGRRGCPGITFANAVMELALANLLNSFDWSLPDGARGEDLDVEETSGLSVHKKNPLIVVASIAR